ncbi:transcriptional activator of acetoin/glycerol metabolism [Burkholderiales bacterium JOSHI_001]|nr:transcriptional activator of acetoin/glycerol metabolism [Burkholderiales bacterium JOSHI_001]
MTPSLHDPAEHVHRILDVVRRGARDLTSDVVAHSWARCINQHRLDPNQARRPPVLGSTELLARHTRLADVIDSARYEMTTLFQQLGDSESAVVLTDTDGVILHMVTSPDFGREVQPLGLEVGAVWSEQEAGTNGMGTCLAAARPIAVRLDDHFFTQYTSLTCSAVPVYDPAGEMTAVLDVTSRSPVPQQHLLVLLGMSARMIENRLIDQRFRDAHTLQFHSRPEFVYTLHEGKLLVDNQGHVLAANRSALMQLGMNSMPEACCLNLADIFQTTLPELLDRSLRASYHPVVTYRANAAHRFFAVARPPAQDCEPAARPARSLSLPTVPAAASIASAAAASSSVAAGVVTPAPTRPVAAPEGPPAAPGAASFNDTRLQAHLATARRVLVRGTPLLLHGETGSGKEVFARTVHTLGPRARGPFVAINCASLPENLIEAELFGYRAGAFTGAERRGRRGKIAQADGGTLFLDEIGDMPLALQARLLRVLDERVVCPLGSDETQAVDFLLVSASHRRLTQLVAEGLFREDLYYRIAGIELDLPALRERSDRMELIRHVLAQEGASDATLSPAAWDLLMAYRWPGNLRQLHHVLRSAVAMADGGLLTPEHFPALQGTPLPAAVAALPDQPPVAEVALPLELAQERQRLLETLNACRWNVSLVAKELDVSRNTLYRRLHKLQIPVTQVK